MPTCLYLCLCYRLCLDKVQRSSKELNCLVLAYMQCIKIVTDWCASNEDFDLLEEILETQVGAGYLDETHLYI